MAIHGLPAALETLKLMAGFRRSVIQLTISNIWT